MNPMSCVRKGWIYETFPQSKSLTHKYTEEIYGFISGCLPHPVTSNGGGVPKNPHLTTGDFGDVPNGIATRGPFTSWRVSSGCRHPKVHWWGLFESAQQNALTAETGTKQAAFTSPKYAESHPVVLDSQKEHCHDVLSKRFPYFQSLLP